jgi:hypothetical protein
MRITRKPLLTEMLWSLYRNRASKDVHTKGEGAFDWSLKKKWKKKKCSSPERELA